jgi:hypothetical protein
LFYNRTFSILLSPIISIPLVCVNSFLCLCHPSSSIAWCFHSVLPFWNDCITQHIHFLKGIIMLIQVYII